MQSVTGQFDRLVRALERLGQVVAILAFAAIVLVTTVDVAMRYLLNSPLIWAHPVITLYLVVALYFGSTALAQREHDNIRIEFLTARLGPRPRAAVAAVVGLPILGLVLLLAWLGWHEFREAWDKNMTTDGFIFWPIWASQIMVPLGFGLLTLRLVVQILQDLQVATGLTPPPPPDVIDVLRAE